jgi:peptide deformylase
MYQHSDHITHISNPEDQRYLKEPLIDVNMRLFGTSPQYRAVVLAACAHIEWLCLTKMEGYKLPHGMSGANAGIPWNIIGMAQQRDTPKANCYIMINPKITGRSRAMVESRSNCGSIRLPEPITIRRHAWIVCDWYDVNGIFHHKGRFDRRGNGLTIQHEVDHNLGVLITDRAV